MIFAASLFTDARTPQAAGRREGTFDQFASAFYNPLEASTPKADLPLWSPATFHDDYRDSDNVEAVHALAFDVDEAPIPNRATLETEMTGIRAIAHTSSSSTAAAPRWRLVVALDRAITGSEYTRLWSYVAGTLPFPVGQAAKDPSRAWYFPRRGEDGSYEVFETHGAPLDVDALLAIAPTPRPTPAGVTMSKSMPARARRDAAVAALGAAWPATGRHQAQLALAGGLVRDGWSEADAIELVCDVCNIAGDEDRPKREQTVRDTIARRDNGETFSGWASLAQHVDRAVVNSARDLLDGGRDAREAFLASITPRQLDAPLEKPPDAPTTTTPARGFVVVRGETLAQAVPPVPYVFRHFGVTPGRPTLLAGYGGIGKTFVGQWLGLAIAAGSGLVWGLPVAKGPVLWLDYEMTLTPTRRRLQRIAHGMGVDLAALPFGVVSMPSVYLSDDDSEDMLCRTADGHVLAFVDNLAAATATSGDKENESGIRRHLDKLTRVTQRTGCTFMTLVHERKAGKDEPGGLQRVRGSSAITDAAGAVISIAAGEGDGILSLTQSKASARKAGNELLLRLEDVGMQLGDDDSEGLRVDVVNERPVDERQQAIEARILGVLAQGPVETKAALERKLGGRKGSVGPAVDALVVRRSVVFLKGQGFVLDTPETRRQRIYVAARTRGNTTPAKVARAACVGEDEVQALVRAGVLWTSGSAWVVHEELAA